MPLFDGSWQDTAHRLRDDELVTLNLLKKAADIIDRFGNALEEIERFGHSHGHGHGYTCANIAQKALDVKPGHIKETE